MSAAPDIEVLTVADVGRGTLDDLLGRYGLKLVVQHSGEAITGSFWGDCEAGIVGLRVYGRPDTPVHSVLHETCHVICMGDDRRQTLYRDAGGDDIEEAAVCYLQIVLADYVDDLDGERLMRDMDAWGYSFRLGSTLDWFRNDAEDAVKFLMKHGLLNTDHEPVFRLRQ